MEMGILPQSDVSRSSGYFEGAMAHSSYVAHAQNPADAEYVQALPEPSPQSESLTHRSPAVWQ
jgi:hypothetical protein